MTINKYPKTVTIDTPDGAGEATKAGAGDAWHVATPTRDFRFYGSAAQMKAEVRRAIGDDYPDEVSPAVFRR